MSALAHAACQCFSESEAKLRCDPRSGWGRGHAPCAPVSTEVDSGRLPTPSLHRRGGQIRSLTMPRAVAEPASERKPRPKKGTGTSRRTKKAPAPEAVSAAPDQQPGASPGT